MTADYPKAYNMASVPFIREVSRILLNGAAFALILVTGCVLPEVRTAEQLAAQGKTVEPHGFTAVAPT